LFNSDNTTLLFITLHQEICQFRGFTDNGDFSLLIAELTS